jgi:4a-hydroxytetrahydrobiopterin dehydratase
VGRLPVVADLLSDEVIEERLSGLDGWSRDGDAITKSFDRGDFVGSVEFVRRMVEPAEEMNHHPDLSISWSEVKVSITNHAAGGLTEADFELAAKIDRLA